MSRKIVRAGAIDLADACSTEMVHDFDAQTRWASRCSELTGVGLARPAKGQAFGRLAPRRSGLREGLAPGTPGLGKAWPREGLAPGRPGLEKAWPREGLASGRSGLGKVWPRRGQTSGSPRSKKKAPLSRGFLSPATS